MQYLLDWSCSRPLCNRRRPLVAAARSVTGTGTYDAATREIFQPDPAAVRAALPHYWRAAFDRSPNFWFDKYRNNAPPYVDIHDRRGRYLARVYAFPVTAPPVHGPNRTPRAARAVAGARSQLDSFLKHNPSRGASAFIRVRYSGRRYVATAGFTSPQGTSTVGVAFG